MSISTRRAKSLRRGIVSGRILTQQLETMFEDRPLDVFIFWAALKVRSYISETQSFSETEALYSVIIPTLERLVAKEDVDRIMHYSALLKVLP